MNKLVLFVLLLISLTAIFACDNDYEDSKVTIGQCPLSNKAQYRKQADGIVLTPSDIPAAELADHEARMAYILAIAKQVNKKFVSSIYFPNGTLACYGVNTGKPNMITHGEIAAINNCTAMYGTSIFTNYTLYTTGEPCSMCASALLWADFKTIVWGTFNSDLYCKICMSNIPIDSSFIFSRSYGLGRAPPRVIGGVLRAQSDAWFGSYCNRPTSIYYIAPQCACSNPNATSLTVTQTLSSTWFDGNNIQYVQYNGVITNIDTKTITYPTFKVIIPDGAAIQQIWGLSATSTPTIYELAWNPQLNPGQTFNFGYILSNTDVSLSIASQV